MRSVKKEEKREGSASILSPRREVAFYEADLFIDSTRISARAFFLIVCQIHGREKQEETIKSKWL